MSNFKVSLAPDWRDVYKLSVTRNGYQWSTIGDLTREQIEEIGKACIEYANSLSKDNTGNKDDRR